MATENIKDISILMKMGAKMCFGMNYLGQQRLKLVYGPFGVFKRRYKLDHQEAAHLRNAFCKAVPFNPIVTLH
jgi:hypothetical protein